MTPIENKYTRVHEQRALNNFGLCLSKVIQLALVGPKVNLKLFRIFVETMKSAPESTARQILDLRACSIHTVHNSFKKKNLKRYHGM